MNITPERKESSIQGLHTATFYKTMREQYDLDEGLIFHKDRIQDEEGRWWDIFVVALEEEDFDPYHLSKVLGPVYNDQGEFVGSELKVRNYYFRKYQRKVRSTKPRKEKRNRMSDEDKRIRQSEYYLTNKEKFKARSRAQYQKNKLDPEWMDKNRARAREHYREKNNVIVNSEETIRRNEVRRNFKEENVLTEAEIRERRLAELLLKDDTDDLTEVEMLELEELTNESTGD